MLKRIHARKIWGSVVSMFRGFTQTKIEAHINLISENAVNLLLCYIIAIPKKNKKKRGNPSNNCIGSSGEVIA